MIRTRTISTAAIDDYRTSVIPGSTMITVIDGNPIFSVAPERTIMPTVIVNTDDDALGNSCELQTPAIIGISVSAGVFSFSLFAFLFFFARYLWALRQDTRLADISHLEGQFRPGTYGSTATLATTSRQIAPVEISFYGDKPFRFGVSDASRPMDEASTEPLPAARAARTWPTGRMSFATLYGDAVVEDLEADNASVAERDQPASLHSQKSHNQWRRLSRPLSEVSMNEDDFVGSPATSHRTPDYDVPVSPIE